MLRCNMRWAQGSLKMYQCLGLYHRACVSPSCPGFRSVPEAADTHL